MSKLCVECKHDAFGWACKCKRVPDVVKGGTMYVYQYDERSPGLDDNPNHCGEIGKFWEFEDRGPNSIFMQEHNRLQEQDRLEMQMNTPKLGFWDRMKRVVNRGRN